MNNSEKRAEALARATKLAKDANERGHNFAPIAELLYLDQPDELAKDLLEIYFELTKFTTESGDGYSRLGGPLCVLRAVYDAFAKMQNPAELTIELKVKDTSKLI